MKYVLLLVALAAPAPAWAQQGAKKPDDFQKRVDAAIEKGIAFLKKSDPDVPNDIGSTFELVLWTFVHAGVPSNDAMFQRMFKEMMEAPLEKTYRVSLQAMILEEVNRVTYQERIWQCAQFLVDNQASNGGWDYGQPTTYPKPPAPVATGHRGQIATESKAPGKDAPGSTRVKPPVRQKLDVRRQREGTYHDNSNTQYAALGLRACHDAGIILPKEVVHRAKKWWVESQCAAEEGTKEAYPARGWYYGAGEGDKSAYGSMTAGAVGGLCIYDYILEEPERQPWKRTPAVQSGMAWLAKHFTVTENPKEADANWHYYYLYALERAGILYGTNSFGRHDWYQEGAEFLLKAQQQDGSWKAQTQPYPAWDTCYAILFLRRATRPLEDVASVDRFHRK